MYYFLYNVSKVRVTVRKRLVRRLFSVLSLRPLTLHMSPHTCPTQLRDEIQANLRNHHKMSYGVP